MSPQDYLNNPMFDSLNTHRPKLSWGQSSGGQDRTITLKPLANVLNPKRRKNSTKASSRKLGVNGSGHLMNHHFNHHHHLSSAFPQPAAPQTSKSSSCKVI